MKKLLKMSALFIAIGMILLAFCSFGAGAALSYSELTQSVFESNQKMMSYGSGYVDLDYLKKPFTEDSYSALNSKAVSITSSCKTDYDKAYVINKWVADNVFYDYDYYYHGKARPSSAAPDVFKTGIAVCEGYARLMDAMCRAAGIPSRIVFGTSFSPIQTIKEMNTSYESEVTDHAWVEVYVNGAWNLCDPTWDSTGRYEYDKKQSGTSGDYYFKCSTKNFSERHYNIKYMSQMKLSDFIFRVWKNEKRLVSYLGEGGKVVIPDVEITVTSTPFSSKGAKVTEVVLPKSQTVIPHSLCRYASGLKKVEIPSGVQTIDTQSFASCTNLETVKIPITVKKISANAFSGDNAIKIVYFDGKKSDWDKIEILSGNDALKNATIIFSDHTHKYVVTVTKEPTCVEAGLQTWTCECGDSYTRWLKSKGHSEVALPAVEATCTESGLTEGKKCSVCGTVTVAQKTIPKKGHTIVTIPAVTATCQKTGLTAGKKCSVCGTVTVAQTVTPITDHSYRKMITRQATCLETGIIKYTCRYCKYSYETEEPRLAHNPITLPAILPTCKEEGLTAGKQCRVCGTVLVPQETVPKKDHVSYFVTVIKEASCLEEGEIKKTCNYCNYSFTETTPKTDHSYSVTVIKEASCLEEGEIRKTCKYCGYSFTEKVPKTGHNEVTIPAVESTCRTPGLTAGKKCSVCEKVLVAQKETARKAHTIVKIPAVEATCKEKGLTEGERCSTCGALITPQASVSKKPHTYSVKIVKEATCQKRGIQTNTCTACGYKYNSSTSLGAHKEVTVPSVAATCSKTGLTEGKKCSVCGVITVAQKETAKTAHKFVLFAVKDPTCTEEGEATYRCSVCFATKTEAVGKVDHVDDDGDHVCDVCSASLRTEKCTCICHKSGFEGFIYQILRIFWKVFGTKKLCDCGAAHY